MSAVAPAGESKKRKKCGTKPQAQINKCNNEKRRREQENIYIEELAELISASFADMSSLSVKPDKCAILQETVNQIRRIKEQEHHSRGRGTPQQQAQSQQPVAAVQQGEVSSSRPTNILASADFAPFLLDALEGFLIIVSRDGRIEQCSPNIERYIRYTYDEVIHQDLFNIIHVGDTARFSAVLKQPLSVGCWGVATGEEEEGSGGIVPVGTGAHNNRSFNCRFLVKPPDDRDASLDERQQRIEKYEQMHVCSAEVLYPPNDENAEQCLMCIVRRIPHTERASTLAGISGLGTTLSRDQFSTKIDTEGNILVIDTSAVSTRYLPYINKGLEGSLITELCPPSEVQVVKTHMKKALLLKDGATLSTVFDLQVPSAPNKYLNIQTTSRLFSIDQIDYIMSTHFIIGISETDDTKDRHSPSADPSNAGATSATNTAPSTPVGGPLMTSVMNGAPSGATPPRNSSSFSSGASSVAHTLNSATSASYSMFTGTELELECFFPSQSWDVEPTWGDPTPASNSRPSSQHSAAVTPVSTPTPRGPGASPCGPQQSPLQPFSNQPQQSPASANQNPSTPSNNNYSGGYTFSPLNDPSPYKLEEPSAPVKENNVDDSMNDSGRLRILLMKPNDESRNKHQILKNLLNQDDEDESKNDNKMSPRGGGLISGLNMPSHSQSTEQPKVSSSGGNDMLLKLLNEKNEDDDLEARAGLKKQSELLQQLLKEQDEELKPQQQHIDTSSQEDQLLRNLGFTSSPSPPGSRKRPHSGDGSDDHANKRSSGDVTSSGSGSRLSEKNKMLASLLAKQPSSTPIPTLPARVITATPQELPRVGEARKHGFVFHKDVYSTTSTSQTNTSSSISMHNVQTKRVGPGRPSTSSGTAYLNQILSGSNANTNNAMRNMDQFNSNDMNSSNSNAGASNSNNATYGVDNADPILSDILDQVIDIVPDSSATAIINILDTIESTQNMQNNYNSNQQTQNQAAAAAIKAIQNSLMQCEDAVKSPSSPQQSVMSLPPGTPPAYSASVSQSFPPPPGYPQRSVNAANVQRFASARAAYGGNTNSSLITTQMLHQQQRAKLLQQQEHKRRLLQQQQQQHMLIPQNATAGTEGTATALQNMDSLLNNTVAPNVSLQRSTSVPDSQSQLSNAGYATAMSPAGQRLGQVQQPYSPSYSVQSQQYQGNPTTRLSPHPPQRQTSYQGPGGTPPVSGAQQQAQWQTQQQNRIGLPQQQNPMLNAQLAGSGYQNRQFSVQRPGNVTAPQRSAAPTMVGSPVSAARQSPFQTDVVYSSAAGGQSPTQAAPQYTAYQHVQQRLQRTLSAPPQQPPTATTHLPGGLCSPSQRGYGPPHHHMHQLPPTYPSSNNNNAGSLYGDVPQYCYDQTGLQLAYNGADRGRAPPQQPPPPPSHMQGGASSNTMTSTSEYVRQELRAVVGARTGQQQQQQQSQQQQGAAQSGVQQQTQQQATQQQRTQQQQSTSGNGGAPSASQLSIHQVSSAELEALGLSFEMPNSEFYGGGSQTR